MAKQAGPRFPYGLGRASRACRTGIPQAQRPSPAPDRRVVKGRSRLRANSVERLDNSFFPAANAQARAELLRQHLPEQASANLRDADEICAHRFRLLGYENLDFGSDGEIDWHLDPVHRQARSPRALVQNPFSRFRGGRRPQGHLGIEPSPASGDAGQSATAERQ